MRKLRYSLRMLQDNMTIEILVSFSLKFLIGIVLYCLHIYIIYMYIYVYMLTFT